MKKIIFTIFIWFIAVILMERVENSFSFMFSIIITVSCLVISLKIWKFKT